MNRTVGLVCIFLLALSWSIGQVEANGQIILDSIVPVKDDKVTFLDPLFTNNGAIENIDTGSIDITRQHEVRVNVPNVQLTGQNGGVDLSGSLGVLISSFARDVSFEAIHGHVSLEANQFHFTGDGNVVIESQSGDVTFDSGLQTELRGSSVDMYARDSLSIDTTGNVQLTAGADLVVTTEDVLTFQVAGVIDVEADKGNVYVNAGGNVVLSSNTFVHLDGPRGTSIDTNGKTSLAGAVGVEFTGISTDIIVKNNIDISFPNVNVFGRDGVVVAGKAVTLDSRGDLSLTGLGPLAEILVDSAHFLHLVAQNGAINLETSGEASDIVLYQFHDSLTTVGDDFTINTPTNIRIGSNETDTFTVDSNVLEWNSDNTYVEADVQLSTLSIGQTKFTARDIYSRSHSFFEEAKTSPITVFANGLSVLSREGDPSHFVTLESDGAISSKSTNKFTLEAYSIDGLFKGTQTYNVRDSTFESSTDRDINFLASQTETFVVEDDIDITTKVASFEGSLTQSLNVADFTINADQFSSLASIYNIATTFDITLTSGQEINVAGTTFTDVSNGVIRIDADDNIFLRNGDASFTSALDNKVEMSDHISYSVANLASFNLASIFHYALSDSWYLKTSNFVLQGNNGVSFDISEFEGTFGSLSITSRDDVTFDTKGLGFIRVYSGHDLEFLAQIGIKITSNELISSRTQEVTAYHSGASTSFTTSGDFHIQGSGDMIWHADGNVYFGDPIANTADSNMQSDIFRAGSNGQLSIVARDSASFRAYDSLVEAGQDIQLFALLGTLNVADQAEPADITLFGHVITQSSSFDNYFSDDLFQFSAVDFTLNSKSFLDISTSTTFVEGETVTYKGTSTSSVTANTIRAKTGYDQYLHANAGATMDFTARESHITSSSDAGFTSTLGFVSITSQQDLTFQSVLGDSTIKANGPIAATATVAGGTFDMHSAEDLSYATTSGNIFTSAQNTNYFTGQDFHVIAKTEDATLTAACAVEFATTGQVLTTESLVGELYMSAYDVFQVRSSIGAAGSFGNIQVESDGNAFFESDEDALGFFSRGTHGIHATTNGDHYGNVELSAAAADIWLYGSQGFIWSSSQDFYILADDGMNITAKQTNSASGAVPTISISSSDLSTIDGARGLIFVAGLDAPVIKSDFSASSTQFSYFETYDQLHVRAAAGHFKVDSKSDLGVSTKEASNVKFSSAGATSLTASQDSIYTTIDGDQYFNSNAFGISASSEDSLRVTTVNGPIQLQAVAGLFKLDGTNWEFASRMDTRLASLGFARLNAGASLRLLSNSVNTDSEDCVLLQNYRKLDSIIVNALTDYTVTAQTNGLTPDQRNSIQTYGDNIDFYALAGMTVAATESLYFGNQTSPVIRFTAGLGATDGISSTSDFGTLVRSQNTITAVGNSIAYESVNRIDIGSTGLIYLISQAGANNWNAATNLNLVGEFLTIDATNNHVIDGSSTASVLFASEGTSIGDRMELRTTGPVTSNSDTIQYSTSILYDFTLGGDYTVVSDQGIIFQNTVPDDANFVHPFFSDVQSERGKILFSVGDSWTLTSSTVQANLGRFGTLFATNATTGDAQQSALSFDITGGLTWNSADYTIQANYEGSTVDLRSTNFHLDTGTLSLTTVVPAKTGGYLHVDPLESDINFKSLGFININPSTSASFTATLSTIYQQSLGSTTYTYSGDWNVDVLNNNQDSLIEFSSAESGITLGNAVTTTDLVFDSTIIPSPFVDSVDDLFKSVYSSDLDMNYDFTDWTIDTGTGRLVDNSATVYLTPTTSIDLTAAAGAVKFSTLDYVSDVRIESTGTLDLLPTFTGIFTSSDLLNLQGSTTSDYTGLDTVFTTSWGDIAFTANTQLQMTATGPATFTSNGYDADNSRAFTLETVHLTATAGLEMNFLAKQGIDINSPDSLTTFTSGSDIIMQSSNYISPVVLNSVNSGVTIAAATNTWHAGAVSLMEAHGITLLATTSLTVQAGTTGSSVRDAGMLFDTNPLQNMDTNIKITGDTAVHTANWMTVVTDHTSADDAGINFVTKAGAGELLTITHGRNLSFLNKHGEMLLDLNTATIGSLTNNVRLLAGSHDWQFGAAASTLTTTGQLLVRSEGSVFFPGTTMTSTLDDLTLKTVGFGRSNDIYLRSVVSLSVTATTSLAFAGSGSDTDIVLESDLSGNIAFGAVGATTAISLFSRSGISLVTSESVTSTSITFNTGTVWNTYASEYKANIFFQSDRDTIFNAHEIRHSNYHSVLGFFSESPAPIYLINLQGLEGCSRVGFCGGGTAPGKWYPNWTAAINSVEFVGWNLAEYLRSWGLVDWTTAMDNTTLYP